MGDKKAICYNSLTKIETYILKMLVQCSNFFHSNMQSDFLVIFSTYSTYLSIISSESYVRRIDCYFGYFLSAFFLIPSFRISSSSPDQSKEN